MLSWYKTKLPNVDPKHHKQWHADRGRYLVRWQDQFQGISAPDGFRALVRIPMPNAEEGRTMLDLVWRGKVFRTRRAAMRACEDHASGVDPVLADTRRKLEKKMKGSKLRRAARAAAKKDSKKPVVDHISAAIEPKKPRGRPRKVQPETQAVPAEPVVKVRKPRADKGTPRGPRRKRI